MHEHTTSLDTRNPTGVLFPFYYLEFSLLYNLYIHMHMLTAFLFLIF